MKFHHFWPDSGNRPRPTFWLPLEKSVIGLLEKIFPTPMVEAISLLLCDDDQIYQKLLVVWFSVRSL